MTLKLQIGNVCAPSLSILRMYEVLRDSEVLSLYLSSLTPWETYLSGTAAMCGTWVATHGKTAESISQVQRVLAVVDRMRGSISSFHTLFTPNTRKRERKWHQFKTRSSKTFFRLFATTLFSNPSPWTFRAAHNVTCHTWLYTFQRYKSHKPLAPYT